MTTVTAPQPVNASARLVSVGLIVRLEHARTVSTVSTALVMPLQHSVYAMPVGVDLRVSVWKRLAVQMLDKEAVIRTL